MSLDIYLKVLVPTIVFEGNITHNLNRMATAAEIYQCLWRPEELGITTAQELIAPLAQGLARLCADPEKFKALNPANGWGDYNGLVQVVSEYIVACQNYPDAKIEVSR